ncbi:MAG: MarR family transcriptional regulator [Hydrogenophaga sp.]
MHHELRDSAPVAPMLLRLLQLCQRRAGITQQELAQMTGRDKGQVARMVKELLEKGLLQRADHPVDRRSHCLCLTPEGARAVLNFERAEAGVAHWLFDGLGAGERQTLHLQVETVLQRLDERLAQGGER